MVTGVSTRESAMPGSAVVNAWRQMEKPQAVANSTENSRLAERVRFSLLTHNWDCQLWLTLQVKHPSPLENLSGV